MTGLTFKQFSQTNLRRCEDPKGFKHALESWDLNKWMVATAGELGEAANVLKKINRSEDSIPGNNSSATALKMKFRKELGDAFVYLDLLAQRAGTTIEACAVDVFNAKSDQIGCPIKMPNNGDENET